ncbi:hypothetical protein [Streptomyces sp. NPDC048489]|uniref:hypothetical protein n=1 Tax=Streptomyces sp. NPDC048489 TaxID=3154504 RepID=UPI00342FAED5
MISEPEMEGEFSGPAVRDVVSDHSAQARTERRPRRPWGWALGGAAAASALWATSVFGYGLGDQKPDLRGYHLVKDSCASAKLVSLQAAVAPRITSGLTDSGLLKNPALDQIQCSIPLRAKPESGRSDTGWTMNYTVTVSVALHKKTDPRAEFEASRRVGNPGVVPEDNVKLVPDLGSKAYLITHDLNNAELRAVDGGAVLSLSLSAIPSFLSDGSGDEAGDGPDSPDLSVYRSAMINDLRDFMDKLRQ